MKDILWKNFINALNCKGYEILILPYGNAKPEQVNNFILSLTDEEFDLLMKNNIVIQAKIFYSKLRKSFKERNK